MTDLDAEILSPLSNRYRIVSQLGDGGFGKTFLVEDMQMPSNRRCVLKQLKPVNDNPQIHQMVQERFQREAAILERLGEHHTQIPRLYAYFSEGEKFYLVEEWIEGDTLTQRVHQSGVLSEAAVRILLIDLLPTIADIHQQGIVHRDIKPDNIILRYADNKPVLIDFGAVKETMSTVMNSQGDSTHSIVVGTPGYMPSEQLAGRPVFSSDLYSLGLTAIYLLTGRQPQQLDNDPMTGNVLWQQYAPNVSPEFMALLDRAIHMNVSYRFLTAQDMLAAVNLIPVDPTIQLTVPPEAAPYPQPTPTVMSSPQQVSSANTQVAFPQSFPSQQMPSQPIPAGGEWKKAVLIGGIIGASILGGALVLKGSLSPSNSSSQASKPEVTASPSVSPSPVSPSPSVSPSPPQQNIAPPVSPAPEPPQQQQPAEPQRPVEPQQPIEPPRKPSSPVTDGANATIAGESGSKNIRTGPGTRFPSQHIAYPGDRVRIIGSSRDEGGYTWYRIYFPKSGADGWIAGQLLNLD